MEPQENTTKELKFYSKKAINITTFFGGPLAASYLIRQNFLSLNKHDEARRTLILGFISTVIIFGGLFLLPEYIMDKFPSSVIPVFYTIIIAAIVEKIHGKILKNHKKFKNEFFSGWKAAGIGLISLIIIFSTIFGTAMLWPDNSSEIFNIEMEKFYKNEANTTKFYEYLDTEEKSMVLIQELNNNMIPNWQKNIEIQENLIRNENLISSEEIICKELLEYATLKLKLAKLFKRMISEDTNIYNNEIQQIQLELEKKLQRINEL